jgi:hypothetical protein
MRVSLVEVQDEVRWRAVSGAAELREEVDALLVINLWSSCGACPSEAEPDPRQQPRQIMMAPFEIEKGVIQNPIRNQILD